MPLTTPVSAVPLHNVADNIHTCIQASDPEDEENTRVSSHYSSHDTGSSSIVFREGVCRTIRKRAGPPQVPPLPPPRHRRTLMAVKHLRSANSSDSNTTAAAAAAAAATRQHQQPQPQEQQPEGNFGGDNGNGVGGGGGGLSGFVAAGGSGGGGNGNMASGVAGMFLGLRMGMVDKAAQEMGKKLALWPGAAGMGKMPSVSSLGSLAAGAISGGGRGISGNNAATTAGDGGGGSGDGDGGVCHLQTPLGSPRSGSMSASTALTDSPVRWENFSSSPQESPALAKPGIIDPAAAAAAAAMDDSSASSASGVDVGVGADAKPLVTGTGTVVEGAGAGVGAVSGVAVAESGLVVSGGNGNGMPRVGSVTLRTPLIQLSDLELAEPCGRRINGGNGVSEDDGLGGDGCGGGGSGSGVANADGLRNNSKRRASSSSSSFSSTPSPPPPPQSTASAKRRLSSLLPPRPDDEYELLFTSRVIGLQFKGLVDGTGVFVAGSSGYVGPAPTTGVPGERLCPDAGDILESYNGVSARGKSAEVVAAELAQCGRPLRLGFRSARADFLAEEAEHELKEDENTWAATYDDGDCGGGGGDRPWGGAAGEIGAGAGGVSCRDDVAFAGPSNSLAISS